MAKALKCDRCGAFYDYIKCLRKYQIHDMDERNFNKTVDLCPDCYAKLLMFLDLDNPDKINKNRKEELKKIKQEAYRKGYADGKHDGYCSTLIENGAEELYFDDENI